MSATVDDEWLRPIDLMVDSYAPELIADDLGRRHAPYLREAQRLVLEGCVPDEDGLAAGIAAATRRYLELHPWLADPRLETAVGEADGSTRAALAAIVANASPPPPTPAPPERPPRRLTLQPAATIVGTLAVRKKRVGNGVEIAWSAEPSIRAWKVSVATRPDPRRPYLDGETATLPPAKTAFEVALDDVPRRIQIVGEGRDGRVVRRAVISALTRGNSGAQWKRQSTAG
jgi:hypothetical protein